MKNQMVFVCMLVAVVMAFTGPAWARGDNSNRIGINVLDGPTVESISPELQELYADEDVIDIVVTVTAGDSPTLDYEWLQSLDGGATWDTAPDATNSDTYTPLVVSAQYMCTVTDGNGLQDSSSVAEVTVYDVPSVVINSVPVADPPAPADGVVDILPGAEGGIVMTATASGGWGDVPTYTYTWQMSIDGGTTWVDVVAGNGYAIADNVLTIDPIAEDHQAIYQCLIDDGHVE